MTPQSAPDNAALLEKWGPVLEHESLPKIENHRRKIVTAQVLENTEAALREGTAESTSSLMEAAPSNHTGSHIQNYDPVLISLVRRAMPNLIAYDICGVQPMTGPTGLIFAMRSNYDVTPDANDNSITRTEAFYDEANSSFSATSSNNAVNANNLVGDSDNANNATGSWKAGTGTPTGNGGIANVENWHASAVGGLDTAQAEALGDATNNHFQQMSFSLEKVMVQAKSRAMKAEYTTELAQDLKAIHGLDAETELANMLTTSLLADINREVVRTIYTCARWGAQDGTANKGFFDLDTDSNGRWSVEKFKGLMFQLEREANAIAKETRMGKGNIVICSSDVASAFQMAGLLDHTPALNSNNLNVDDTGNTFVGVLNGRFRVYIDPYSGANYMVVGYKGSNTFDAGIFYAPYVPLQMVRAIGENTFQAKIGFKTRYGMVANPFAEGKTKGNGDLDANSNRYYRRVLVNNLM